MVETPGRASQMGVAQLPLLEVAARRPFRMERPQDLNSESCATATWSRKSVKDLSANETRRRTLVAVGFLLAVALATGSGVRLSRGAAAARPQAPGPSAGPSNAAPGFTGQIEPLLVKNCLACHA